jgi:hypothetical protein
MAIDCDRNNFCLDIIGIAIAKFSRDITRNNCALVDNIFGFEEY